MTLATSYMYMYVYIHVRTVIFSMYIVYTRTIYYYSDDCEWREDWNAYRCQSLDHRMLVIESLDGDTETRRLSPLALDGGDTGHGPYTDLLNGPMDHG